MTTGWLKAAVINAAAPKVSIIHRLKQNLGGFQPARDHSVVHASDVTKPGFCPRQWALIDILGVKKKDEFVSTAMHATYDMGNATASLVVENWLGDYAVGNWKCQTCQSQRTFSSKPKNGCKNQQACNWKYVEMRFESQTYGVDGSIDVMVDLASSMVQVTELKIIKVEDFKELKFPQAEHTLRTQMYLKLIADSDSPFKHKINLHEARVLYTSRGYGIKNVEHNDILPWKEFTVARNDDRVSPLLKKAQQIKFFRDARKAGESLIPSGLCTLPTDKHAKTCGMCNACFSGQYPAQQPPLED
jgi:hypothetical protein